MAWHRRHDARGNATARDDATTRRQVPSPRRQARRPMLARTLAVAVAFVLATTGCRSLLPQDDDSAAETVGKTVLLVPVVAGMFVADIFVEEHTGAFLFDDDPPAWDESRHDTLRAQAREDFRRPGAR